MCRHILFAIDKELLPTNISSTAASKVDMQSDCKLYLKWAYLASGTADTFYIYLIKKFSSDCSQYDFYASATTQCVGDIMFCTCS